MSMSLWCHLQTEQPSPVRRLHMLHRTCARCATAVAKDQRNLGLTLAEYIAELLKQNEHKMGMEMLGFEMIRGQDADAGTQLVVCTLGGFRQRTLGLLLQKVAVHACSFHTYVFELGGTTCSARDQCACCLQNAPLIIPEKFQLKLVALSCFKTHAEPCCIFMVFLCLRCPEWQCTNPGLVTYI